MERYSLHSITHIFHYANGMSDDLILSILIDVVIQLWLLTFDAHTLVGWSYMDGCIVNVIALSVFIANAV